MKGKVEEFLPKIKQRLFLRYQVVDAMTSNDKNGSEKLAFKFANKYDIVVACGGDGTLHQVVNGIMKSGANPIVGLLPFGTCNDVAKTLKIPFNLDKAIDCILRLNTTDYDLIFDGQNYISYSMATGYLTKCAYSSTRKSKKAIGKFAYIFSALKNIFKFQSLPLTITYDGIRIHGKFLYFMLISGETAGGFKLNKNASIDNGKVQMVLIKSKGLIGLINFAKLFLFGIKSISKSKNVIVKEVEQVEIENHSNTPFIVDGEKAKFLKKSLNVCTILKIIKK